MWTENELDFSVKVNEAPKKIYITPHFQRRWFTKEIDDVSIEYTRTDVLIDDACEWLENNLQGIVGGSIYIEDFRKHMKG